MANQRRERRPTEREQAKRDLEIEKQTRKELAAVKAKTRQAKKAAKNCAKDQNRNVQKAPFLKTRERPEGLNDFAFTFHSGSQHETPSQLLPRRTMVLPAQKNKMAPDPMPPVARAGAVTPPAKAHPASRALQPITNRVKSHTLTAERAAKLLRLRRLQESPSSEPPIMTPIPSDDEDDVDSRVDWYDWGTQDLDQDPHHYSSPSRDSPSPDNRPVTEDTDQHLGSKRARSNSIESVLSGREAIKNEAATGRAKAADWDPEVQAVLHSAITCYKAYLSSEHSYPGFSTEICWAQKAWQEGCRTHKTNIKHKPELLKLITSRASHLRGEIKSKARGAVTNHYGFQSTSNAVQLAKQRDQVEALKTDFAYVYRSPGLDGTAKSGFLMSRAIQDIINPVWFKSTKGRADAIILKDMYMPFPVAALALVMTAIECALDEWSTGTFSKVDFYGLKYKGSFESNLKVLRQFEKETSRHQIIPKLQERIYRAGCTYAQVEADPTDVDFGLSADAIKSAIAEFTNLGSDHGDDDADDY